MLFHFYQTELSLAFFVESTQEMGVNYMFLGQGANYKVPKNTV